MINRKNDKDFRFNTNLIHGYIASPRAKFYETDGRLIAAMLMVTLVNDKTGKSLGAVPVKSMIYNTKFRDFYAGLRKGDSIIARVRLTPYRDKRHLYRCGLTICNRVAVNKSSQPIDGTGYLRGCIMSDRTRFYPAKHQGQIALIMVGLKDETDDHIHGIVPVKSFIPNGRRKDFFNSLQKYESVTIKDSLSPYVDYDGYHRMMLSIRSIYAKQPQVQDPSAGQQDGNPFALNPFSVNA